MFIWLVILTFAVISGALAYTKRYSSTRTVGKLYFIQFFYLFVVSPAVFISLFNIALKIYVRPPVLDFTDGDLLFSLFAMSLAIGVMGSGIHSTSTSVFQAFRKYSQIRAYSTNETFHGPLSHDMTFAGSLLTSFFLALLEISRPATSAENLGMFIFLGILIGLGEAVSIIWSTHLGLNLAVSFVSASILGSMLLQKPDMLFLYPVAVSMFSLLITVFVSLLAVAICIIFFKSTMRKVVGFLFPSGHPVHESFSFL